MYETIKHMCEEKGLNIKELERRAGIGNGTIGGWRTSSPNLDSLEKVADALDIKVETLIRRARNKEV